MIYALLVTWWLALDGGAAAPKAAPLTAEDLEVVQDLELLQELDSSADLDVLEELSIER